MTLDELKAGDVIYADGAMPCLPKSEPLTVKDRNGALYVSCNGGQRGTGAHVLHFLDRHVDPATGTLAGFARVPTGGAG
jgi:hypothetical protein